MQSLESASGSVIPTFGENKHTKGVMKIRCSTPAAKSWLTSAIQYFPPLWKDMKLAAIDFNDLPRSKKVLGLFQNCNLSNANILKMLGAMNTCVDTNRWSIISKSTTANGTHIVMGINEDQLAVLQSCNFQLYFGAGVAKFKDISKKIGNAEAPTEAESDMEVGENEDETDISNIENVTIISVPTNTDTQGAQQEMQQQLQNMQEQTQLQLHRSQSADPVLPSQTALNEDAKMDLGAEEAVDSSGN